MLLLSWLLYCTCVYWEISQCNCKQTDRWLKIHCWVVVIHFEMCKVPKLIYTKANKNMNINDFDSLHVPTRTVQQSCRNASNTVDDFTYFQFVVISGDYVWKDHLGSQTSVKVHRWVSLYKKIIYLWCCHREDRERNCLNRESVKSLSSPLTGKFHLHRCHCFIIGL